MLMEAVPVRFVTVPELGVPNAPPLTTKAPEEPVLTAKAVATPVPKPLKEVTGIVDDAVTLLVPFAYIYPVNPVTVNDENASDDEPNTFSQAFVVPLKIAQSPTDHKEIPFKVVVPAVETM